MYKGRGSMRLFTGIEFNPQTKQMISDIQKRLKPFADKGRWKYWDNLHLTVRFLGEVENSRVSNIHTQLKEAVKHMEPFRLSVSELGMFPGSNAIRVLWLGLDMDVDCLALLKARVDDSLQKIGFPLEKRGFRPHITIAQDVIFSRDFSEIKKEIGSLGRIVFDVNGLSLFKSEQIGQRRVYTNIGFYHF